MNVGMKPLEELRAYKRTDERIESMKTKAMKDGNATCPLCGDEILDVLSTEVESSPRRQLYMDGNRLGRLVYT